MDLASKLLEEIESPPSSGIPLDTLRQFLAVCREANLRLAAPIARCAIEIIARHRAKLSEDELWSVYEQGTAACLDCGLLKEGDALARQSAIRFPRSLRVKVTLGRVLEAYGNYAEADELYDSIIKEDPLNMGARRRKVAVAKARGGAAEAIAVLTRHVDTFMGDQEAWEELADCHLALQQHKQAAFCLEELLLLNPGSFALVLRYADVLYSMGGRDHFVTARKYYARAVELSGGASARALYGICACQAQLEGSGVPAAGADGELGRTAARALAEAYRTTSSTGGAGSGSGSAARLSGSRSAADAGAGYSCQELASKTLLALQAQV